MTPAEYAFVIAQIFLARTLTPFAALLVAGFWLLVAMFKGL
jgi:hypothetical protein